MVVMKKNSSTRRRSAKKNSIRRSKHTRPDYKNKSRTTRKNKISINIRRSSGRKEKFDTSKLAQTTGRSGVPFMMARDVAQKVSKKILSVEPSRKGEQEEEKTVTAGEIRNMIAEELRNRNEQAKASSYAGEAPENMPLSTEGPGTRYVSPVGTAETRQHEAYRADADSVMHDQSKRHQSST